MENQDDRATDGKLTEAHMRWLRGALAQALASSGPHAPIREVLGLAEQALVTAYTIADPIERGMTRLIAGQILAFASLTAVEARLEVVERHLAALNVEP